MSTKSDLELSIVGLKLGMGGITISIASTMLGLSYPDANPLIKQFVLLALLLLTLVTLWITYKIKLPSKSSLPLPVKIETNSWATRFLKEFKFAWRNVVIGFIGGCVVYVATLGLPLKLSSLISIGIGLLLILIYSFFAAFDKE